MSGPAPITEHDHEHPGRACVQLYPAHESRVGGLTVRRVLPHRQRRMVGAWCFADHMGPAHVDGAAGLKVGPHPHQGLQTVTWLIEGEILHKDSLGSYQIIRPGQVNLMSAGQGVSHSEESTQVYRGTLEGIQLWIAQTDATRWDAPAFRHHAVLPTVELDGGRATVVIGSMDGVTSPEAQYGDDVLAAELDLTAETSATSIPVRADHEYAVVVLRGSVTIDGTEVTPGSLAYLGTGRDALAISVTGSVRAMLIGGAPFEEEILMWWNLVARSREEMETGRADWESHHPRFGEVDSTLTRYVAPPVPWAATPR